MELKLFRYENYAATFQANSVLLNCGLTLSSIHRHTYKRTHTKPNTRRIFNIASLPSIQQWKGC